MCAIGVDNLDSGGMYMAEQSISLLLLSFGEAGMVAFEGNRYAACCAASFAAAAAAENLWLLPE